VAEADDEEIERSAESSMESLSWPDTSRPVITYWAGGMTGPPPPQGGSGSTSYGYPPLGSNQDDSMGSRSNYLEGRKTGKKKRDNRAGVERGNYVTSDQWKSPARSHFPIFTVVATLFVLVTIVVAVIVVLI
jgi:hypothetical protein